MIEPEKQKEIFLWLERDVGSRVPKELDVFLEVLGVSKGYFDEVYRQWKEFRKAQRLEQEAIQEIREERKQKPLLKKSENFDGVQYLREREPAIFESIFKGCQDLKPDILKLALMILGRMKEPVKEKNIDTSQMALMFAQLIEEEKTKSKLILNNSNGSSVPETPNILPEPTSTFRTEPKLLK